MKIIYIAHSKDIGGSGVALVNIIKAMKASQQNVIVVLPPKGKLINKITSLGVRSKLIPCAMAVFPPISNFHDFILFLPRFCHIELLNIIAFIRFTIFAFHEKPDLIHTNSGVVRWSQLTARILHIPHIWHLREYIDKDFQWTPIGGISFQKHLYHQTNNHCIAITSQIYKYFQLSSKDTLIYDGVFSNTVNINNNIKKLPYFLYVGTISPGKGIIDLIKAFDDIANNYPNYELLIIGDNLMNIQNIIKYQTHADRIKYLGYQENVYQYMAEATALVVPSYSEGFGFVTVESMLNKTIVIGRDTSGTKEQFDNGFKMTGEEIGLRFTDIESLKQRMQEVIENPSLQKYKTMIENASNVVRNLYSNEICIKNLLDYYNSILGKK